uniref:Protein kinase domain-containing protein n=1 Tax=Angiostrongylus cantonensis TaxID=6313 RepID=A0A0K0DIZ1_ANGCA
MFAMKVEKKIETRKHSKLKMEIAILKLVSNERNQSHFTAIIDRGKKETYFFLVMELVGKSLADLKNARPDKVFSVSTGLGASIQCLEACEDLHKYGFIHRDLKPANYACGLGEKKRVVYILDFGIARRILNDKNELKTPRVSVRFKGTIPFASLACHKGVEMGPKDDCESWYYLMLDLTVPGVYAISGLIWKRMADKNEVMKVKEECRTSKKAWMEWFTELMFGPLKCKNELARVLEYIDKLHYHDHVDYTYIYKMLEEVRKFTTLLGYEAAAIQCGGNVNNPYDWENDS